MPVGQVEDLNEEGGVGGLLIDETRKKFLQLVNGFASLLHLLSRVHDLIDEYFLWWRSHTYRRTFDEVYVRAKDLAFSNSRHEVQRTNTLLFVGEKPAVA